MSEEKEDSQYIKELKQKIRNYCDMSNFVDEGGIIIIEKS